ncbi:hypothetical protein AMJ83_00595 [candidate division WOR_3 bacterium SM23_42]|uniref:Uncharacterized protein n=1 Tax=candidate division WOR_3 bacterium SM23_42 TaxID=1703779 RepID=A0A0S8FVM4_UNCW3|nr:MAG: hypothetical protein AMJ83_00595 [candidate division WOR_3 bacterium SM23_42]
MQRNVCFFIIILNIIAGGCAPGYVEHLVTNQGAVIELDGARFEIPANSVAESTLIRIEKLGKAKRTYAQGFSLLGNSYVIEPETLVFLYPMQIVLPAKSKSANLGAKIGRGFVPLVDADIKGETLTVRVWHGGEYYLIENPKEYGIIEHTKTKEGLLLVSDIYISDYVRDFKDVLRRSGYDLPVWLFVNQPDLSIEDNVRLLHEGLRNLHSEYGDFRLDVVSFGVGGLVTHRYLTDSAYYQRDISSAVLAIGTPFLGTGLAYWNIAMIGKSPLRFFFIDGMGSNADDVACGSEFISLIQEKRRIPGHHYYDDPTENKNFASLYGLKVVDGSTVLEEKSGDGLVFTGSARLTAIEPSVFELDHFELFESPSVHKVIAEFVKLYRSFNWPMLFSAVWEGRESITVVNSTWERETKLHLRNDRDFDVLMEYNRNMLNSAPQSAILITNGDYDTYPAWYLQEKGVRQDVIIVNRSLLNIKDYARYLKRMGLPLTTSDKELERMQHKKGDGRKITISDQLMQVILKQKTRPVVFSTTVYQPEQYGYPLKLSGLVYEISESDIDIARTRQLLFEEFEFERLLSSPVDSINANLQNMILNYAAIAFQLAATLEDSGEYSEAIEVLEFARRFGIKPMFYYNEARIYFKMGMNDKANEILQRLLQIEATDVTLVKEVAKMYYDNGMREKAVMLLAVLSRDNPKDKELIDLIRKYRGE